MSIFDNTNTLIISSPNYAYAVEKELGRGSFGTVVQCRQLQTCVPVAVKVVTDQSSGQKETEILDKLRALHPDKHNILKFLESFTCDSNYCFVFELLDVSIAKLISKRKKPFCVSEIRPVAQQMLVALKALKSIGVVHTDIKPDNIMFVHHEGFPFKAKLIDFGLAREKSTMELGKLIQATPYRAPEVVLGLPLDEGVDMWSLGCVLAGMLLARHLYPTHCQYELMRAIEQMQGPLPEDLLRTALRGEIFYNLPEDSSDSSFRLNTPQEYMTASGQRTAESKSIYQICPTLDYLPYLHSDEYQFDCDDTRKFISLLKLMLSPDKSSRISPEEALAHTFITMGHLSSREDDPYVVEAINYMRQVTDGRRSTGPSTSKSTSSPKRGQETVIYVKPYRPDTREVIGQKRVFTVQVVNEEELLEASSGKERATTHDTRQMQEKPDQRARADQEKETVKKPKEQKPTLVEVKSRKTFFKRIQRLASKFFTALCPRL